MIHFIDHIHHKDGVRVLQLTGRNKDGAKKRVISRVSRNAEKFDEIFDELLLIMKPEERIYASASARDVKKASVLLKHRMVDNDLHQNPTEFYENLNSRWISCLMDPTCQSPRKWMFDCDTIEDYRTVLKYLESIGKSVEYQYKTKNGYHILMTPFHMKDATPELTYCRHDNPLMLWAY